MPPPGPSVPKALKRKDLMVEDHMGPAFMSPLGRRDPKKAVRAISMETQAVHQRKRAKMEEILRRAEERKKARMGDGAMDVEEAGPGTDPSMDSFYDGDETQSENVTMDPDEAPIDQESSSAFHAPYMEAAPSGTPTPSPTKKNLSLYNRWLDQLPSLLPSFEAYEEYIFAKQNPFDPSHLATTCTQDTCEKYVAPIRCVHIFFHLSVDVRWCNCQNLLQVLITNGMFPAAPTDPRIALSMEALDLYQALFEKASDAVLAYAGALRTLHIKRGWPMRHSNGALIEDPFRRAFAAALPWYNNLQILLENKVELALIDSETVIQMANTDPSRDPNREECDRLLQQRCPACFFRLTFGTALGEGADFHVCVDGNFNHRHIRGVRDSPQHYEPTYFLSKAFVDEIGDMIEEKRRKPPPASKRTPRAPEAAVEECQSSHTAGSGSNAKSNMDRFDAGGVMALVCRHDIPLFLANIDTPGEQQKYAVALIDHFLSLVPSNATVAVFYDVGCVLDRSFIKYGLLDEQKTSRIEFATSAMHAYAHQWACQLGYSPRLRPGLGLTDGEGVERLWSKSRKLVGITRTTAGSLRIRILDRQMHAIGNEIRNDLGPWIRRKMKQGVEDQLSAALTILAEYAIPNQTLRDQWEDQKESQMSLTAHAPARIKKELETILDLQTQLETLEKCIENAGAVLAGTQKGSAKQKMESLTRTNQKTKAEMADVYASLSVHEEYPHLTGDSLELMQKLFIARDLKIFVRKKAIGSFFEWDRLDQAVGGRDTTIGTKRHQSTRQAIARRKPALLTAITKYNNYCAELAELADPDSSIPIPEPLPKDLQALRNCPHLMQDVWISDTDIEIPLWLQDADVRDGIRALLKTDRCREERKRLEMESRHLLSWFSQELGSIMVAIAMPSNRCIRTRLQARKDRLIELKTKWSIPNLTSVTDYDQAIASSEALLRSLALTPTVDGVGGSTPASAVNAVEGSPTQDNSVVDEADLITKADLTETGNGFDDLLEPSSNPSYAPELEGQEDIINELYNGDDELDAIQDGMTNLVVSGAVGGEAHDHQTRNTSVSNPVYELIWSPPDAFNDQQASDLDNVLPPPAQVNPTLELPRLRRGRLLFDADDLKVMSNPTARLTGTCINGFTALLQDVCSQPGHLARDCALSCAIFSTYDLPGIHAKAPDDVLWRRARRLLYWAKPIWIVPIHRPSPVEHWVLVIVSPEHRALHLFDSLAEQDPWTPDIEAVITLVERLEIIATVNGYSLSHDHQPGAGWTAQPVIVDRRQHNGFDCGLWVLASALAVLNGYITTGLQEEDMIHFRCRLLQLALSLPCHANT